jgi:hypothetical protein
MSGKCRFSSANNERETRAKTKKEQRNAAHFLADYQPLKLTNRTPKKRAQRIAIYSDLYNFQRGGIGKIGSLKRV